MSPPHLQVEIHPEIAHETFKTPPLILLLSLLDRSLTVSFLTFKFPTFSRPLAGPEAVRIFFVTLLGLLISIGLVTDILA